MKYLISLLCALCVASAASAATPSPESIGKLLKAMNVEASLQAVHQQMDGMMKNSIAQAMQGQAATPEAQKIVDEYREKCVAIASDALSFDKMKPIFVQIYTESFTQDEVDQLVVFFESPTGRIYVKKLPVIAQNTMGAMQQITRPMMEQIIQAAKDMKSKLDALQKQQPK